MRDSAVPKPQPSLGTEAVRARKASAPRNKRLHVIVCCAVAALIVSVAVAVGLSAMLYKNPSGEPAATATVSNRFGTIVRRDGRQCQNMSFDNDTGRVIERTSPCDSVALDARGAPIPLGTMGVINSISKSFK